MPFITRGFNKANMKILQKIRKAWNKVGKKDKELRRRSNSVIGDYHKWLKSRTQGIAWHKKLKGLNGEEAGVPEESEEVQDLKAELGKTKVEKEKLKVVVTRVRKECDKLKDVNMSTTEALEQKMKKARKEEWSRNKFRGALLGSSNELKVSKAEKDKSRMENMMLKDKLRNFQRSKGSLKE